MKRFLLLLDGMMGVGKSTTAKIISKDLPRTATISVDTIKNCISDFQQGPKDWIIGQEVLVEMARKFLQLNFSVIVEAVWDKRIPAYEDMAKTFSVPCYKFQLTTSQETAYQRVLERHMNSTRKRSEEHIRNTISSYTGKDNFEVIDTTNIGAEEVAKIILERVNNGRA